MQWGDSGKRKTMNNVGLLIYDDDRIVSNNASMSFEFT